ncbi:hypothetical protein [Microbulbifer mangrovi]|uniref:hypothetical protein n=1 Tax=Microbulbifer mangrovi TaxID=927787 RepID=UPI0009908DE3|nr:hypothetical protein [Microbulbifer mangrovi]
MEGSEIDDILSHLSTSINHVISEILDLPNTTDEKLSLYGPYLGRSLLELSATALIARLDPFKIILIKGKQETSEYDLGKPHSTAIRWQGDIVDVAVPDLWAEKSLKNPTRALLGAYQIELVLKDSAQKIVDEADEQSLGTWYSELTKTDTKGLFSTLRGKITALFSSFSKGVHHELLIPNQSVLDRDTVYSLINDAFFVVATLGLLLSRVPHAYQKSSIADCDICYKNAKELELG